MTSRQPKSSASTLTPALTIPLLAAVIILPLLRHGPSCGHDYGFHVQSWMDASDQLRQSHLLPRWAFSPAFNAGEPRFVFYPPLSWLLGSLLLLTLPSSVVTTAYTFLALTAAAAAMYALAARFTSRWGAVLASAVYIGNPYVFFTAFERTAFAELLAAAWMPLLFRAALAESFSPLAIAISLALLWLTNAPAAVMGTYVFVLIVLLRWALAWRQTSARDFLPMLSRAAAGLVLGLALPAFYLLPAAFERRYVQIAMAIIPNMRVEDNFLFGHTGYVPHDQVLHTASLVALGTVGATALVLIVAFFFQKSPSPKQQSRRTALHTSILLAVLIASLLWRGTLPIWHHVPELAFLQFPWRLLAVLGTVLGLGVALALPVLRLPPVLLAAGAFAFVAGSTLLAYRPLRQVCEANELPTERVALYRAHHGVGPTDEYTPTPADNDQLRWHDPAYWLTTSQNAPAPGTVPNPAATEPDYDALPPIGETISGRAPMHLQVETPLPEVLVLNLRDYPAWQITVDGNPHPAHLERDDGLLAVDLPKGPSTVDIRC